MLVLSFGFAVSLARFLDPSGRGNFALLQTLTGIVAVTANFAVGKAIIHHLGKRLLDLRRAAGAALLLAMASGVIGAIVFTPISLAVHQELFPGLPTLFIVFSILLALPVLVREYLGGIMIGLGLPLQYVATTALQPAGSLVALFILVGFMGASLNIVVGAWGVGILLSAFGAVSIVLFRARTWPSFKRADLVSLGRFGLRAYPAFMARFFNLRLDQLLVRLLASAAVLGQYAVAVNMGELLIRIPNIMLYAFSGQISAQEREASASLVAQFCRWSLIALGFGAVLIAIGAPFAVPFLFGSEYRPAALSVVLLLPGMIAYAPAVGIAEYFLVQRAQPGKAALLAGSSLVVSSVLNVPLTPLLGSHGASIASSVSYIVMFMVGAILFGRDSKRPISDLVVVRKSDLRLFLVGVRAAVRSLRSPRNR